METLTTHLKTLADGNRLRILALLSERKMCVCELAFILGVTQPSISRHLKKLSQAGLIEREQNGFWTDYFPVSGTTFDALTATALEELRRGRLWREDLKRASRADRKRLCCP